MCALPGGACSQAGEIESETAAILEIEGIRRGDFGPEVEACLPPIPWVGITEEDLRHRRDFRCGTGPSVSSAATSGAQWAPLQHCCHLRWTMALLGHRLCRQEGHPCSTGSAVWEGHGSTCCTANAAHCDPVCCGAFLGAWWAAPCGSTCRAACRGPSQGGAGSSTVCEPFPAPRRPAIAVPCFAKDRGRILLKLVRVLWPADLSTLDLSHLSCDNIALCACPPLSSLLPSSPRPPALPEISCLVRATEVLYTVQQSTTIVMWCLPL